MLNNCKCLLLHILYQSIKRFVRIRTKKSLFRQPNTFIINNSLGKKNTTGTFCNKKKKEKKSNNDVGDYFSEIRTKRVTIWLFLIKKGI